MRKTIIVLSVLVITAIVGTYFYFSGNEYVLRFSETELQAKLDERLPLHKSYLIIFEVVLDNPRVALIEGSDRVNAGLDITLNIRIGSEPLPLGGSIYFSGGVQYAPGSGQFFLTDPVIESLGVQGVPDAYVVRVREILTKAIDTYFATRPIYTLKRSDTRQAAARMILKGVVVRDNELVVTIGI